MIAQFLKVGGVSNEADFYKKYPTKAKFMAKCGKKIKAFPGISALLTGAGGAAAGGAATGAVTGGAGAAGGGWLSGLLGGGSGSSAAGQGGVGGMLQGITGGNPIGMAIDIFQGAKAQKNAVAQARQTADVMEFMRDAKFSNDRDEQINLQRSRMDSYVRPEDYAITGEELFPMYGVGTNVLAKEGKTMKYQSGGDPKKKQTPHLKHEPYTHAQYINKPIPLGRMSGFQGSPATAMVDTTGLSRNYDGQSYVPYTVKYNSGLELFDKMSPEMRAQAFDKFYPLRKNPMTGERILDAPADFEEKRIQRIKENLPDERGMNTRAQDNTTVRMPKLKANNGQFLGMTGDQWKGAGMQGLNSGLQFGLQKMGVGDDLGSMVGGKIGGAAGSLLGPVGGMIGGALGSTVGDLIDRSDSKIKKAQARSNRAIDQMIGLQMGKKVHSNFQANLKDGGTMKYGMGGQVQTYEDGGSLTPISSNPYGGDMHMINGPKHSQGGVDMNVMGTEIEAEGGEPIQQTSEGDMAIMGNLEVPSHLKKSAQAFTGETFSGKKFKNVMASIGKAENKVQSKIDSDINKAEQYTPVNKLDRISLNTLNINLENNDTKLKKLQVVKDGMVTAQEGINELEGNDAVAKYGARFPSKNRKKKKKKYNTGGDPLEDLFMIKMLPDENVNTTTTQTTDPVKATSKSYKGIQPGRGNNIYGNATADNMEHLELMASQQDWFKDQSTDFSKPENLLNFQKLYNENNPKSKRLREDGLFGNQMASVVFSVDATGEPASMVQPKITGDVATPDIIPLNTEEKEEETNPNNLNWLSGLNQLFRGSNAEPFDNRQLLPEAWAMANNKLEPVQAQKYNPRLRVPYDISLQDQLNQNTAKARQAERMVAQMGPQGAGALAALKAEEYMADQRVLGDQFRQNQGFKDQVYSQNLQTLNDADLKNLAIADKQYERQEMAKALTKATDQKAITSMVDKRLKHNLENQTLRVFENMYDYRFDKAGRAWYMGEPADFTQWTNIDPSQETVDTKTYDYLYDAQGNPVQKRVKQQGVPTRELRTRRGKIPPLAYNPFNGNAKNGMLVKKLKKYK